MAMDTSGNKLSEWTLPEYDLEAFTITPDCQWFFGTDPNGIAGTIKRYDQ